MNIPPQHRGDFILGKADDPQRENLVAPSIQQVQPVEEKRCLKQQEAGQ